MNKTTLNSQKEKHSMLSLRRATSVALPGLRLHLDFYPRSPCGERPPRQRHGGQPGDFYPRSPCGERPHSWRVLRGSFRKFLSTLSLRRATAVPSTVTSSMLNFYPRSPCGERRRCNLNQSRTSGLFLSTLSLRRATNLIP